MIIPSNDIGFSLFSLPHTHTHTHRHTHTHYQSSTTSTSLLFGLVPTIFFGYSLCVCNIRRQGDKTVMLTHTSATDAQGRGGLRVPRGGGGWWGEGGLIGAYYPPRLYLSWDVVAFFLFAWGIIVSLTCFFSLSSGHWVFRVYYIAVSLGCQSRKRYHFITLGGGDGALCTRRG